MKTIKEESLIDTPIDLPKKRRFGRMGGAIVVVALLVAGGGAFGLYKSGYLPIVGQLLGQPTNNAAADLAQVKLEVSKHYALPAGEEPSLVTIDNAQQLASQQAFFANAHNGDKLLLYPKSMQAILYSPSMDKIINVGPIQVSGDQSSTTPVSNPTTSTPPTSTANTAPVVKVEVRNGGGVTGAGASASSAINKNKQYTVTRTTDAANNNYKASVVVVLNQADASAGDAIAQQFGATAVAILPDGEASSNADIVLIIGAGQ